MTTEEYEFARIQREIDARKKAAETNQKFCHWVGDSESYSMSRGFNDAHNEAQQYLWDNYEVGDEVEYCVAEVAHPVDTIDGVGGRLWVADHVIEYILERIHDEVGGDDEAIKFTNADRYALGDVLFMFFKQHGRVKRWGVKDGSIVTVKHVVGSER
jgi:hypothetical protein